MKKILFLLFVQAIALMAFTITDTGAGRYGLLVPETTQKSAAVDENADAASDNGNAAEDTTAYSGELDSTDRPYSIIPGVYGFGTETRAAYGLYAKTKDPKDLPKILHVNTLSGKVVNSDSTHGSFAWAVTRSFPRIVVFDISGVIKSSSNLYVKNPYMYVAGQTAPGFIVFQGGKFGIQSHDIVIQHLAFRIRPGTENTDGVGIETTKAYNVVVDHCSISWATDENISPTHGGHHSTISNCIIAECLRPHSTGSLVSDAKEISIIGNLYAHNNKRHPSVNITSSVAFYNNVVYNWGWAIGEFNGLNNGSQNPNGTIHISYIGNYCKSGPDTSSNEGARHLIKMDRYSKNTTNYVWMKDNILDGKKIDGIDIYNAYHYKYKVTHPIDVPHYNPYSSDLTLKRVLANAGARSAQRDAVDERIVSEVLKRSGGFKYSTPSLPTYTSKKRAFVPVSNPHGQYNKYYTNIEHQLHQEAWKLEGK